MNQLLLKLLAHLHSVCFPKFPLLLLGMAYEEMCHFQSFNLLYSNKAYFGVKVCQFIVSKSTCWEWRQCVFSWSVECFSKCLAFPASFFMFSYLLTQNSCWVNQNCPNQLSVRVWNVCGRLFLNEEFLNQWVMLSTHMRFLSDHFVLICHHVFLVFSVFYICPFAVSFYNFLTSKP